MSRNYSIVSFESLCKLKVDEADLMSVIELYYKTYSSTIYVMDDKISEKIIGIVTLGDVFRHRREGNQLINRLFTYITIPDEGIIQKIYSEKRTVCEVPIIDLEGKLLGAVVFENRTRDPRIENGFDSVLKSFYLEAQIEKAVENLNQIGAHLISFIYPDESEILTREEMTILQEKKRYESGQLQNMTLEETEKFFGDEYFAGISNIFKKEYDQITAYSDNGRLIFRDQKGRFFNIENGKRITSNNPDGTIKKMFLVGACFAFGAYVGDERTISFYLQDRINKEFGGQYKVINCGNLGSATLQPLFCEEISKDDVVVLMAAHPELVFALLNADIGKNNRIHILSEPFKNTNSIVDNIFNSITHHNYLINHSIADYIFDKLKTPSLVAPDYYGHGAPPQNYYIDAETYLYFEKLRMSCMSTNDRERRKNGAVVMNCNPFTNGHRFLVEKALEHCDHLFIFVVEEDLSFFSFGDRLTMVKEGLKDLTAEKKVTIIPSGKYIISKDTFAQYFEKEKEFEIIKNMEFDIRIFAEIVCNAMGIKIRFAGKEPTDPVTNEYNNTMRALLPQYGIGFMEFERKTLDDEMPISATNVRKWIREERWDMIDRIVPKSTLNLITKLSFKL